MIFKQYLREIALPIARVYWKIFKPTTFGVKVLIKDETTKKILVVRHTYGDQTLLNLPGGGYNPKKETPIHAAVREIQEEVSATLTKCEILGEYSTNAEGKQDTVTVVSGHIDPRTVNVQDEIRDMQWMEISEAQNNPDVAKIVKFAVGLIS
jgi:8-oxo-dGTP diphosphatase